MVGEALAHAVEVLDDGDVEGLEVALGADAGEEEEARGVVCAGAEDDFFLCEDCGGNEYVRRFFQVIEDSRFVPSSFNTPTARFPSNKI